MNGTHLILHTLLRLSNRHAVRREMELWGGLLDGGKRLIEERVANTSYVNNYLRARTDAGHALSVPGVGLTPDGYLRDKLLAYTAGTILEAGSDTTASTMQSFILFMLAHPPVLERVRAEIDAAVGAVNGSDGRMPEFDDEEKCPYFVACIKETLRRRPPTIMGMYAIFYFKTHVLITFIRYSPSCRRGRRIRGHVHSQGFHCHWQRLDNPHGSKRLPKPNGIPARALPL